MQSYWQSYFGPPIGRSFDVNYKQFTFRKGRKKQSVSLLKFYKCHHEKMKKSFPPNYRFYPENNFMYADQLPQLSQFSVSKTTGLREIWPNRQTYIMTGTKNENQRTDILTSLNAFGACCLGTFQIATSQKYPVRTQNRCCSVEPRGGDLLY